MGITEMTIQESTSQATQQFQDIPVGSVFRQNGEGSQLKTALGAVHLASGYASEVQPTSNVEVAVSANLTTTY